MCANICGVIGPGSLLDCDVVIACGHSVGGGSGGGGGGGGGGAERVHGVIAIDFAGCAGRVMEVSIGGGGAGG